MSSPPSNPRVTIHLKSVTLHQELQIKSVLVSATIGKIEKKSSIAQVELERAVWRNVHWDFSFDVIQSSENETLRLNVIDGNKGGELGFVNVNVKDFLKAINDNGLTLTFKTESGIKIKFSVINSSDDQLKFKKKDQTNNETVSPKSKRSSNTARRKSDTTHHRKASDKSGSNDGIRSKKSSAATVTQTNTNNPGPILTAAEKSRRQKSHSISISASDILKEFQKEANSNSQSKPVLLLQKDIKKDKPLSARGHIRSKSDNVTSSTLNKINNSPFNAKKLDTRGIKNDLAKKRLYESELFLAQDIIKADEIKHKYVYAFVIYGFLQNYELVTEIIGAIKEFSEGRIFDRVLSYIQEAINNSTKPSTWLSNCLALHWMCQNSPLYPEFIEQDKYSLQKLCSFAYLTTIKHMISKFSSALRSLLLSFYVSGSSIMIESIIKFLQDYILLVEELTIWNQIKSQFYTLLYHYLNVEIVESLIRDGCSYNQAINCKMLISHIEEKLSRPVTSNDPFLTAREAANLLLLPKDLLLDDEMLKELCPTLSQYQINGLILSYKPEAYYYFLSPYLMLQRDEQIPREVLSKFQIMTTPEHDDCNIALDFNFKMESLDDEMRDLPIPKVILSAPGFEYLNTTNDNISKTDSFLKSARWEN